MVIEDWQFWSLIILIIVLIVVVWKGLANIVDRLASIRRDEKRQYVSDKATGMSQLLSIELEIKRGRSKIGTLGMQLETLSQVALKLEELVIFKNLRN